MEGQLSRRCLHSGWIGANWFAAVAFDTSYERPRGLWNQWKEETKFRLRIIIRTAPGHGKYAFCGEWEALVLPNVLRWWHYCWRSAATSVNVWAAIAVRGENAADYCTWSKSMTFTKQGYSYIIHKKLKELSGILTFIYVINTNM